ncbi:MAG TPA: SURF1 family protein [Methylophilaceae bacterium]|jgi:surfeit locus 1 family protein
MKRIAVLCKALPYRFAPKLAPTIVTLLLLPVLVSLGQWQTHRAEFKQHLQDKYNQAMHAAPLEVGSEALDVSKVRYHTLKAQGHYEPAYQILLDNQISQGKAGYEVVTPLHVDGSEMRILVNRGWIPATNDRRVMPNIVTPQRTLEVSGIAADPSSEHYMELSDAKSDDSGWQKVWQNLDIKRYIKLAPFPVQSVVIDLDPASSAGGFVRDWPLPDAKVTMHKGYAFQWFGMALMLAVYYLVASIRKRNDNQTK